MKVFPLIGTTFALIISSAAAPAAVVLGPLFQDHAVLQRDRPVPVWGWAKAAEHVTVSFAGQIVGTTAGPDGLWEALLAPLAADGNGFDLTVTGETQNVVHDVVVGDVWLCSGQSNMEFTVDDPVRTDFRVQNAPEEVTAAHYPLIRQFKVARHAVPAPAATAKGAWSLCSPATVPTFTAVGYFFARDLYRRLQIPIGLIDSTWGGTGIEAWSSPIGYTAGPAGAPRPGPNGDPNGACALFDGMIHPLLPCAVRGILWYQGEHNAEHWENYRALFASLITTWRRHLGGETVPFYWVQLANFRIPADKSGQAWAYLREAQAAALSLPETGQAVAIDVGDPNTVHPRNKQEVGRRLALIAKARVYGLPVDYSGPVFLRSVREGWSLRLYFRYADNALTAAAKPLQSFALAGPDRRFYPARAVIEGSTVVVRSPEVPDPVAVRYAWSDNPEANFYNGAGLPAAPFRSDTW